MNLLEKEKKKELTEVKNLFLSIKSDKENKFNQILDEREKQILGLPKNWDDNGAETISKKTLGRVRTLLRNIFKARE